MMYIENNVVCLASIRWSMFEIMVELMDTVGGYFSKYTQKVLVALNSSNANFLRYGSAPARLSVEFPIDKLEQLKIELAKYGEDGEYFLDMLDG